MADIFQRIYEKLKRNEKEMLIGKSGSVAGSHHEKVRSGQSYLYKKYGMESEVIEVRFKEKVTGSFLNQALSEASKRYPYFNTKLIEMDGDFYIVQNNGAPIAKRTKKLPVLGHISCQYRLVEITYYDSSVFISFHHALCDGRGIVPFVETLIYYYCKYKFHSKASSEGIRLADDPLLEGENTEPFTQSYEYDKEKEKDFPNISRDAYAIPENVITEDKMNYRYEVKIPHADFMRVCKENNATPVILVALMMSHGICEIYPDYDKPINANIATDIRGALDCPNTFKNCVKSMILPFCRELAERAFPEQVAELRSILNSQRDRDYCRKEANNMLGLSVKLDKLDSFEKKQQIMSFFDGMTLNTYVISYIGQYKLNENARYVDDIHLYNSGTTGLGINMTCCGEHFMLDFKQNFPSDKYVKAFLSELDKLGIPYQASDVIPFATPEDSLIKRKNHEKEI